jgi:hypothetical protein
MARRKSSSQHPARRIFGREWLLPSGESPPLAAHVVVSRSSYTHHGIHVGDGRVVHYSGLARGLRRGAVEEVSLAEFACGRAVWVRPCDLPRFDPQGVVARARSRLGENHYRLLSNNCEHFCEWCVRGEHRSHQIDAWREWPRRILRGACTLLERQARGPSGGDGTAWAV